MPLKKKPADLHTDGKASPQSIAAIDGPRRTSTDGDPGATGSNQLQVFEQAVREFRAQRFAGAKELFERVLAGPQAAIAHNARLHIRMCERRLEKPKLDFGSPEDHYNYAVERINARDLDTAREHLQIALDGNDRGDHLYYALALCCGLSGDSQGAYEHLRRAIELEPNNRIAARQDADFAGLAQTPLFQQLLSSAK